MIERSIAVVSGKGGAGKTMIATALAHELAIRARTLIVDLDVFNRGLSGLLKTGKKIADIPAPEFLGNGSGQTGSQEGWALMEVAPNVVTLRYPDISRAQRQYLEAFSITELSQMLDGYMGQLQERCGCAHVVLDCHGGPDMLSFAAATLCTQTILVSEPDRITFYGTLHFIRRMAEDCPSVQPNIRLLFNKVMPAFTERYLRRFYDASVKQLFQNEKLLAVVPFEAYLSKEFEKYPFVTQVYPFSRLAGAVRTITRELGIRREQKDGKMRRWLHSVSSVLGAGSKFVPRILNMSLSYSVVAIGLAAYITLDQLRDKYPLVDAIYHQVDEIGLGALFPWFFISLSVNWIDGIDRWTTRAMRLKNMLGAMAGTISLAMMWGGSTLLTGFVFGKAWSSLTEQFSHRTGPLEIATIVHALRVNNTSDGAKTLAFYIAAIALLWMLYNLIARIALVAVHERRYFEAIIRALVLLSGIMTIMRGFDSY